MPIQVRDSDSWNTVASLQVRDSGDWNDVQTAWVYTDTYGWKVIFPAQVIPTVSVSVSYVGYNFIDISITGTNSIRTEVVVRSNSFSGSVVYTNTFESPVNLNNFSVSIIPLEQSTTYYITVTAYSVSENSASSSTTGTTIAAIIPTVNLSPTPVNLSTSSFGITWESTNQYNWRVTATDSSGQVVFDSMFVFNDTSTRAAFIFGLNPSSTYTVSVWIQSIDGNIAIDSETFTTTNATPVTINSFTSSSTRTSITYSWTASGQSRGEIEFGVGTFVGGEPAFTGSTEIRNFTTSTSSTFSSLSPGTGYVAKLTLYSINDEDSDSATLYTETQPITAPSIPNNFSGFASSNGTSATFSWSAPTDDGGASIIRYEFQRTQTSTPQANWLNLGQVFSYTASSLTPGTTYYFRVRAVNSFGLAGDYSTVILTTPTPTVPGTPSGFFGISSSDGTFITLSWNAPSDGGSPITTYEFQRNQSPTPGPTWLNIGNTTSWVSNNTVPGTLYYFRVRAINAIGTGSTATTTVTANNPPPPTTAPPTTAPPTTAPPTTAPPTTAPPTTKAPASLAPDTKILTSNYGYIEAKYISVGDELVSMDIAEIPTDGSTFNVDNWSSETFTNNGLTTTIVNNIYAREIIGNMIRVNGEWFTDNHNILSEKDGIYKFTPAIYLTTEHKIFDYDVMDWVWVNDILVEENVSEIVMVLDCEPYDVFFTQNSLVYNTREYLN